METLMLIIDTVGVALLLYWSMKNDRKPKDEPQEGWLRIADPAPKLVVDKRRSRTAGPASRARRL